MTKSLTKFLYLLSKLQIDNSQIYFGQRLGEFYNKSILIMLSFHKCAKRLFVLEINLA